MKANLNLGKYFGTRLELHWSFFVLMLWVILNEVFDNAELERILFNLQFVIAVMVCVLLHEIGHAVVAKKFGIKTEKMVLLPIGGISTTNETTEKPKEEFFITMAGPLANILIAVILYFVIPVSDYYSYDLGEYFNALNDFTLRTFLYFLFIVNVALAVFNMIPAFPLDGGHIFRAVLDLKLDRANATKATTTMGHIIAIALLLIGLLFNPIIVFMSLFLFVGNYTENIMATQLGLLGHHTVGEAMLLKITIFKPNDHIDLVVNQIISGTETNFIVMEEGTVKGILNLRTVMENSNKNVLVKDIMDTEFEMVKSEDNFKHLYNIIYNGKQVLFPVIDEGKLVGAIDATNLNEYIALQSKLVY